MEQNEACRPVPAPRRLYPELRKLDYENVTVDLINKNLNINSENIHTAANCAEKVPNNKVFLVTDEQTNGTSKSILTETNDLYGPNANENVPAPIYATPQPAPRPRNKPQNNNNNDDDIDESIYQNATTSTQSTIDRTKPALLPKNTGAISKETGGNKIIRKAPDLPPKNNIGVVETEMSKRALRHSVSSEFSTTSSRYARTDSPSASKMHKSASNATLNSSLGDSTESSESSKFKSPSPGDLFKSLGTTSKLLTESIGERIAVKSKVAKQKLDKNIKSSSELLSSLGTETTTRLKSVSKRFGTNFTLSSKKEKDKNKENVPTQYGTDRPQTLPPNDQVFNTISFSSPLQRKAPGFEDLRENESDCSYDMPRSLRSTRSGLDLALPPSYDDALGASSPTSDFVRNTQTSKSLMVPKHIAAEAANIARAKQRSNANLNRVSEEKTPDSSDGVSRDSLDQYSPPMPNFPPPALPNTATTAEGNYGKLNPIQPPARQKRRKNYEQIQLRREVATSPTSLRPNVDSAELHQLNLDAAAAEREESMRLREEIQAAESCAPKPDRSESWEYFEEESESSSPEPVYANHEATYGKVFEMASQPASQQTRTETDASAGAVGGWVRPPKEIIQEFDPLLSKSAKASTLCSSDKSNQLLLLEHLLEEDIYGTVQATETKSDDDISMCTSEEDNLASGGSTAAAPVEAAKEVMPQTMVLPTPNTPSTPSTPEAILASRLQIVHQNARLLSDSMENMLDDDESRVRPYLSRLDEPPTPPTNVDLARASQKRTNWFVDPAEGTATPQDRVNPFNKMNIVDGDGPPSYLEAIGADGRPTGSNGEQKSLASRLMNPKNMFSNVKIRVDALKRKTSFRTAQRSSDVRVTLQMVPRPSLSPLLVRYEGQLIRFPSGVVEDILKEMQHRRAILRDRQFQTYLDHEMKTPKEIVPLECITTLQCVSNNRVTDNATHFYCFEITTAMPKNSNNNSSNNVQSMSNPNLVMTNSATGNCKHQRVSHLYGVGKESERDIWMQKLLESLTNVIPSKYVCHYYRAGWCYLKTSITSEWSGTWLVLKKSQRRLVFVSDETQNVERMDLRKARCVVIKDSDDTIRNLHVESGPTLMIDCPPFTVYMIMSSPRETKIWRHIIREVAHNNGFALNEQQLTKYNVPVIVDKCINFVYIHGSMSEGIYRKSGSEASIAKLLGAFRADAFNVEITRNEYNEHDVANVLKRFMRDLPERLLGKLTESFICVGELKKAADKIPYYKELLSRLTIIERETLKKIVGHLAFISSQKPKNKMSVQNLTMIWGPTLLQCHQAEEMVYSQKEADVLSDLIMLYKNLFPLSADEMKKEQEMLLCLQKYYAAAETLTDSVKKSGDLKMWITLDPRPENANEEKTQVNVTISPTKTAYELCRELAGKMSMALHQVCLFEVILNGSLERPLHHDTKVFDVVLNWSYWPEDDRKHNILVVRPLDLLRVVHRAVMNSASMMQSKELKFADNRTKSFKMYQCELRDGKIVISKKDKNDKTTIVREIFLQSTTAYLGYEKKRDCPWSWAITFVERTQTQILRSRDAPFIGHVLAGSEWVDRNIWYSSIWYCLHGDNILPPAEIIIK